nr:flagellar basal body-associated FliL family protein [Thioalkalivibrio sp.]
MAEAKQDLDLGRQETSGGTLKLVVIIMVTVLVMMGAAGGAWYLLAGGEPAAEDKPAAVAKLPHIYRALEPALLGNIDGPGRVRFVQVEVVMATRDPKVLVAVDEHTPVIRNDLIMLLSGKTYEQLNTAEGKERTRREMLDAIRSVLEDRTGNPGIESIYFTSFVMQ